MRLPIAHSDRELVVGFVHDMWPEIVQLIRILDCGPGFGQHTSSV